MRNILQNLSRRSVWGIALLSLSLCACVTQPVEPVLDSGERLAALQSLDEFGFRGGLGIWTDEQSISARLTWQQSPEQLEVQLSGPLGIGDMQLLDRAGFAVLSRAGAAVAEGPLVDTVLQRGLQLAAPVPVRQLQQWVKGLPGNAESVEKDEQGRLSSLQYRDEQGTRWEARFLKYSNLDGLPVPSLITASGGDYSVRLVLKDWRREITSSVPEKEQSNTRLAIPTR